MSHYDYTPNPRIVARAAELWVAMLTKPQYDNLGPDSPEPPESILSNKLASAMTSMLPANNTADRLKLFGLELQKILLGPYQWEGDWNGKKETHTSTFRDLGVDYHPDVPLSQAAKAAGLEMEFPWKTRMWLDEAWVSVSCGYAAPSVYHYPLTNDRWFLTQLSGNDMPKILALIEAGEIPLDWNGKEGTLK